MFGVRWSVLLTACAAASTGVCLLVFFTARRLAGRRGGYWAGLCAAVLYLASPLENDFAIRALRDISPLWFAALAFACLVCLVERFRSAAANGTALGLTGFACTLGCGWRPDALLLVPVVAASAAIVVFRRRKSVRYLLAATAVFLLGAALPLAGHPHPLSAAPVKAPLSDSRSAITASPPAATCSAWKTRTKSRGTTWTRPRPPSSGTPTTTPALALCRATARPTAPPASGRIAR